MPLLYTEHSLDFDGSDDYVLVGNVAELSFDTGDAFSMSCWVKVDAVSAYHIFMGKKLGGASPARGYEFGIFNTGECFFALANNAPTSDIGVRFGGVSDLVGTGWHHVVVTYDGSGTAAGITAYIDAESRAISVDSDDLAGSILEPTALFRLGSSTTTNFYDGRLAEASVYDKELSFVEVATIYNAGSPPDLTSVGPTGNLVGYWRPGEHSYPTVPDLSPSGNDGTMTNMAANDIVVDAPRPHEAFFSMLYDSDGEYCEQGVADPDLDFSETDDFTISVWVKAKVPATGAGTIISCADNLASYHGWSIRLAAPNKLFFQLANGALSSSIYLEYDYPTDVEWHHVLVTHESHTVVTYVDASPVAPTSSVDNLAGHTANSAPVRIGRLNAATSTQDLRGAVSDAAIWGTVLTPSQVTDLYGAGVPRDPKTIGENSTLLAHMSVVDRADFPSACYRDLVGGNGLAATNMEAADVRMDAPEVNFEQPSSSTESIFWAEADAPGYVDIGTPSELAFERTDSFSISAWVRYTGGGTLIGNLTPDSTARGWELFIDPPFGDFNVYFSSDSGSGDEFYLYTDYRYDDDKWHHVCVVYYGDSDPTNIDLYVDGVSHPFTVDTDNLTGTIVSAENVKLGKTQSEDTSYDGYMDDVAVYNKALSEEEVRTIYGSRQANDLTETMPQGNLVGYWKLGDGSDTFPDIADLSPLGNDGVMSGYLHTHYIANDRPPGAAPTQYSIGIGGRYDATDPLLDFGRTDPFSLALWFRNDSPTTWFPTLVSHQTPTGYVIEMQGDAGENPGGVMFSVFGPTGTIRASTDTAYNDGTWYHAVITYDGSGLSSGITFYIDGAVSAHTVHEDTLGAEDFYAATPYRIYDGLITGSGGYIGSTCQHAVYDKELTAGEVTTIYGAGAPPDLTSVGPTGNLVAWWPVLDTDLSSLPNLDDAGSNDITMVSWSTNTSIVSEAPAQYVSQYSTEFDGVNDVAIIGDVPELSFERTDPFTLSAWARVDLLWSFASLIAKRDGSNVGWGLFLWDSDEIRFNLTNSTNTNEIELGYATIGAGSWHNFVVTYDGSSSISGVRVYQNGVELSLSAEYETNLSGSIVNAGDATIGLSQGQELRGLIDEVAVYNRVLSPSEVDRLGGDPDRLAQDHGAIGPLDSLVGWWRMGDPGPSVFPTIADESVSRNDATLTNMDSGDIVEEAPYLAVAGDIDWSTYAWPIDTAGPWQPAGVAAPPQADPVTGEPIGEEDPPYYKMRALADPGPGYVTWVVTNSPDFAGAEAPSAIQGGSAVLTTSWNDDGVQFVRVPSIDIIQPVTNSAAATDPGIGLSLVLVDTADAAWDDLDTITLPAAPQAGAEIIVKDDGGQAASERISVLGNGNNIDGQASRLVQNPREALHLLFDGTEWRVV